MRLTKQQRWILEDASRARWVSARMLANGHGRSVEANRAALNRLAVRGLLARDEVNAAIYRITDSGREALA